jgi:tRNA threonylcarbamoyladenosine modification (KEOPS) complex  Pcc1 subunit
MWEARVSVRSAEGEVLDRLARTLGPEAAGEGTRLTARVVRAPDGALELELSARDTSSMRAALNTYLGWVHLALRTSRVARAPAQ